MEALSSLILSRGYWSGGNRPERYCPDTGICECETKDEDNMKDEIMNEETVAEELLRDKTRRRWGIVICTDISNYSYLLLLT